MLSLVKKREVRFTLIDDMIFITFFYGLEYIGARRFRNEHLAEKAKADFIQTGIIWD
jgi:hypothetical protein